MSKTNLSINKAKIRKDIIMKQAELNVIGIKHDYIEIADAIGISRVTLWRIIAKNKYISLDIAQRIVNWLGGELKDYLISN